MVQDEVPARTPAPRRAPVCPVVTFELPEIEVFSMVALEPVVADEAPKSWRVPVSLVVQDEAPTMLQLRMPDAEVEHEDVPTIAPLGVVTGNAEIGVELIGRTPIDMGYLTRG